MSRRHWVLVLPILVTFAFVSCAGGTGPSEEGSSEEQRRFLSLGTAPPGGAFFVVGGALADVLSAEHDTWRVTAEATKGTQENLRRLDAGELDLALANSAISYFAVRGEEGWEKEYPIRSVMTLAPNVALFLTREGSGIESIADLKGHRVVVGPAGAGFEFFLKPILGAHGVTYEDFTALPAGTQASTVDNLADGSADAVFLGGAVPTASITQAAASMDVVFIPYGDEEMEELTAQYPFFGRATIPAGTYRGLEADYHGLDVGSMHLVTAANVPEDLVYQATKILYENREDVVEKHAAGKAIQPGNVVRDVGTPFHPGAERYYREIGIWPESDD